MKTIGVRSVKISEQVANILQEKILNRTYLPGDKLPSTRELTQLFDVSPSTIREALSALKAMGLVESRQGEGSFVKSFSLETSQLFGDAPIWIDPKSITDLLEVRISLETSVAAMAAERRTDLDLQRLEDIIIEMKKDHLAGELGEEADYRFHHALAKATQNGIMVQLIETITEQMKNIMVATRKLQERTSENITGSLIVEHEQILTAVKLQQSERAAQHMQMHLEQVKERLLQST